MRRMSLSRDRRSCLRMYENQCASCSSLKQSFLASARVVLGGVLNKQTHHLDKVDFVYRLVEGTPSFDMNSLNTV